MSDLITPSQLVPSARQEGDTLIMAVRGELDLHNSPELRSHLLDLLNRTKPKRLIFDMSAVPYMDSSALAVLVEALQKLRKIGGRVCLVALQPRVQGLLEIARLSTLFNISKDEQEAMSK